MRLLLSGEGPTDLGQEKPTPGGVAFVPGAVLFAVGMRARSGWRPAVIASGVAAAIVLFSALVAVALMPAGIAQRLGYAAWLLWLCVAAWRK